MRFDLVAVGAGSASFAAAIAARDRGASVALVERGTVGGTCVNVGCVPSKALLRAAEELRRAGHHPFDGVETSAGSVDLATLVSRKDELVAEMRRDRYVDLIDEYGFELIRGHGAFTGPETLEVGGRELTAGAFLIATGASPAVPPIAGLLDAGILTSTTALEITELPGSIAVIGANAVGLELGQLFLHLGSTVTFVEALDRVAPFEEPEVGEALAEVLRSRGAEVLTSSRVQGVRRDGDRRIVEIARSGLSEEHAFDQVLVATGRRPNTDGMGLEAAGVELDERGAVDVDEHLRTSNPRVFAAGDVTSSPQFVYVAAYQGALAAENAVEGADRRADLRALPRVTFTDPQVASVGITESEARAAGRTVKTSVLPLSAVPRAIVSRDTSGLVKLVADEATDELLGASMLAENAGDGIQAAAMAIRFGASVRDVAEAFHPYLTMAEGLKLAAQTFTRDVAKLSCCAA